MQNELNDLGLSKCPHLQSLHLTTCLLTLLIFPVFSSSVQVGVKTTSVELFITRWDFCRDPITFLQYFVKMQVFTELYLDFQSFAF